MQGTNFGRIEGRLAIIVSAALPHGPKQPFLFRAKDSDHDLTLNSGLATSHSAQLLYVLKNQCIM